MLKLQFVNKTLSMSSYSTRSHNLGARSLLQTTLSWSFFRLLCPGFVFTDADIIPPVLPAADASGPPEDVLQPDLGGWRDICGGQTCVLLSGGHRTVLVSQDGHFQTGENRATVCRETSSRE